MYRADNTDTSCTERITQLQRECEIIKIYVCIKYRVENTDTGYREDTMISSLYLCIGTSCTLYRLDNTDKTDVVTPFTDPTEQVLPCNPWVAREFPSVPGIPLSAGTESHHMLRSITPINSGIPLRGPRHAD